MTIEEKIQHFNTFAMEDARKKSAAMIDEYTSALEQIFQEHKEKKIRQADLYIKTETDQLIRRNNKTLSEEQIQIKRILSKKQKELKDKLFVEVRDMLALYSETPEYNRQLVKQMKEAIAFARGEDIILYIDPSDVSKQLSLEVEVGAPIKISEYSFIGGMRAVIPSRNILIDQSFETKLVEAKDQFSLEGGKNLE